MLPTNYRLKDRTYNISEGSPVEFKCYSCEAELMYIAVSPKKMKYCYNCDKKVILRSAYETIEKDNTQMV